MRGKPAAVVAFAALSLAGAPASAGDLRSKIINSPTIFRAWGTEAEWRKDSEVQGGQALRITTTGKERNLHDVGVYSPVDGAVKAGDRLILAFWARVERSEDGTGRALLPNNVIQVASPPFRPVVRGGATLSSKWEVHQVTGVADRDYAPGELSIGLQLASGKQVVDIGPVFAYDLGQ